MKKFSTQKLFGIESLEPFLKKFRFFQRIHVISEIFEIFGSKTFVFLKLVAAGPKSHTLGFNLLPLMFK